MCSGRSDRCTDAADRWRNAVSAPKLSPTCCPGDFANVSIDLPRNAAALSVPAIALIFDQSDLRIATVGADDKVVLKKVTIARDLGKVIELGSGLTADDRVIESLPDGVADGDLVRIAQSRAAGELAAPKGACGKA